MNVGTLLNLLFFLHKNQHGEQCDIKYPLQAATLIINVSQHRTVILPEKRIDSADITLSNYSAEQPVQHRGACLTIHLLHLTIGSDLIFGVFSTLL